MTAIVKRKTTIRAETSVQFPRKRPIIVELAPYTCILREKGKRTRYEVSWSSVFHLAAQIAADKVRAERKARRTAGGKVVKGK